MQRRTRAEAGWCTCPACRSAAAGSRTPFLACSSSARRTSACSFADLSLHHFLERLAVLRGHAELVAHLALLGPPLADLDGRVLGLDPALRVKEVLRDVGRQLLLQRFLALGLRCFFLGLRLLRVRDLYPGLRRLLHLIELRGDVAWQVTFVRLCRRRALEARMQAWCRFF